MKRYNFVLLLFIAVFAGGQLSFVVGQVAGAEKGRETFDGMPVIDSNKGQIIYVEEIKEGENGWGLAPEAKPDILNVGLIDGKPHRVTFYTDVDSISFMVELGQKYDFIIRWDKQLCYQQLVGVKYIPAAVFDEDYIREHKGKIFVRIPDVYEMVNVGIALSKLGKEKKNFVYKETDYYQKVRSWFDKFQDHPFIEALNAKFARNQNYYHSIKMNGYSFYFDEKGKIRRSPVFDRTAFRYMRENNLLPYLAEMQSFADESDFLTFYQQNADTYQELISVFQDSIDLDGMIDWLDENFPAASDFDSYNIIFSPLVAYNQSSTWYESNRFKELQPHVNFPYRDNYIKRLALSPETEYVFRGNIVFTELNHGYMAPEEKRHAAAITQAVSNRSTWVDSTAGPNYYAGSRVFAEYMNWGLISLRFVDYVPESEQAKIIQSIENQMVRARKFSQFKAFNQHLLKLYRNRPEGATVADLYPQIIQWFEANNH